MDPPGESIAVDQLLALPRMDVDRLGQVQNDPLAVGGEKLPGRAEHRGHQHQLATCRCAGDQCTGALGAATHLMRLFGVQKTRRMLYTGESISAEEAYRMGSIESVVPRDELRDAAMDLARKIASKSPKALRLAKWSLNGIELLDVKESYRYEQGFTLELYTSPDSQESRDAFVEKRDASFDPPSDGSQE